MLHALQHIILWGKFRSLNKRYHTLIEQAKRERDKAATRHVEENFWYETAVLLEQRRRLQSPNTARNPFHSNPATPTVYPKTRITSRPKTETSYSLPEHPPSTLFMVIFSLLGSIAIGTGILWLVAPLLFYLRIYFLLPLNLLHDLFPNFEVPVPGLLYEVGISLPFPI